MTMKLYGSLPSPYVRRVRMALDGFDYEFVPVNIYDDASRAEFSRVSPIRKLPVLVNGAFNEWGVASNALTCLLDWAELRELYRFDGYPALLAARQSFADKPIVVQTYPVNPA